MRKIAVTALLEYLNLHACFMLASGYSFRRLFISLKLIPFLMCHNGGTATSYFCGNGQPMPRAFCGAAIFAAVQIIGEESIQHSTEPLQMIQLDSKGFSL